MPAERAGRLAAVPGWVWQATARDTAWEDGIARLQAFAAREGHARVPVRYRESDGYSLGKWVTIQRHAHKRGTMPAERAGRLAAVPGWVWQATARDTAWEDGFARLQEFVAREGHARAPGNRADSDGGLGAWVRVQRQQHARGVLADDRARRLAELPGWIWDPQGDAWENGMVHLEAFAAREGHARVPATHREADGYRLGAWVSVQRGRYRREVLVQERAARLAALPGWSWAPSGAGTRKDGPWEDGFARLQAFAAREGHARVPTSHRESDHPLGQWVSNQRSSHRQGMLAPERSERLAALPGWSWNTRAGAWEAGFARLEAFAAREGHARVLASHRESDGHQLGLWVHTQRARYAQGTLADDRARRLAALPGWTWAPRGWEQGFARLLAFVEREGHAQVPDNHRDSSGYPLGQWVNGQRRHHARGGLPDDRALRLVALPGWLWKQPAPPRPPRPRRPRSAGSVWSDSEDAWNTGLARLQDFARREGHARVTSAHHESDGYRLGEWVRLQRRSYRHGRLEAERAERLAAVPGWSWDSRGGAWDVAFARLERCAQRDGLSDIPLEYQDDDGFWLGQWAQEQRRRHAQGILPDRRARRLETVPGWSWSPPAAATTRLAGEDAWADGLAHLEAFARREGHARVPGNYRTSDGYGLGTWVSSQRGHYRKGKLEAERAGRLAAVPGWSWDPLSDAWDEAYARLERYAQREGSAGGIGVVYADEDGFRLGYWVNTQRRKHALGALADDRVRRLEAVQGWAWEGHGAARRSAHRNR